jgi:hypothetical protein
MLDLGLDITLDKFQLFSAMAFCDDCSDDYLDFNSILSNWFCFHHHFKRNSNAEKLWDQSRERENYFLELLRLSLSL